MVSWRVIVGSCEMEVGEGFGCKCIMDAVLENVVGRVVVGGDFDE